MPSSNASHLESLKRWRILQPLRPLVRLARRQTHNLRRRVRFVWWQRLRGRPPIPPPPEYKVAVILDYARRFHTPTLIETGTYLGDTVEAARGAFRHIWSIEIDDALFAAAVRRFAPHENVTIVHGDSAKVLPSILAGQSGPILFWLDGHFSGGITARGDQDTPIVAELEAVLARSGQDDVILIDDARDFGAGDYPSIAAVAAMVHARRPGWSFIVDGDIIRTHAPVRAAAQADEGPRSGGSG